MAFNVLNIGFAGTISTPFVERQNWVSNGDTNDIFYYIGTNFGQSAWSNPLSGSFVSFVGTEGNVDITDGNPLVDNSVASRNFSYSSNTNDTTIARFNFNDCLVRPTGIQMSWYGSSSVTATSISLQGSIDGSTWITLDNIPNQSYGNSQVWDTFETGASGNQRFFEAIRVQWTATVQQGWGSVNEIKLYGDIKRTDGGQAARASIPQTFASLGNVDIDNAVPGDALRWFNGKILPLQKTIYRTQRIDPMTGDLTMGDTQMTNNYYILNPNGTTRNFDLPTTPTKNQYFRVRSLDNAFEIRIREAAVTQATIGGAGGPGLTQADMWYDGSTWHIITY